MFTFKCCYDNPSIKRLICLFGEIGWKLLDEDNKITYLPVNDKGLYNWESAKISMDSLLEILLKKEEKKETIGLQLYYEKTGIGISLLLENSMDLLVSADINRKTISSAADMKTTDVNWYIENIILKLRKKGCIIEAFKFEEF